LISGCQVVAFDPPTSGTSDDGGAEPEPDPVYNCDPVDLQACDEGQKCTVVEVGGVQNVYECVDDIGTLEVYAGCTPAPTTGQDSCPKGTVCIAPDENGVNGYCVPMCDDQQECAGVCAPSPYLDIPLCGDACNPLEQACPVVLECHPEDENFGCQFKGDVHDGGPLATCTLGSSMDGCAEGLGCAQGSLVNDCELQNCCTPLCDTTAMVDPCAAPHQCTPLTSPPPEAANVGICIVPA
jgi:hypothetical protein